MKKVNDISNKSADDADLPMGFDQFNVSKVGVDRR